MLKVESVEFEEYAREAKATVMTEEEEKDLEDGGENFPIEAEPFNIQFWVYDDKQNQIGRVGMNFWNLGYDGTRHLWITNFAAFPERRGLGTAVMRYIKESGFTAETYGGETDEGKPFWEKMYDLKLIE